MFAGLLAKIASSAFGGVLTSLGQMGVDMYRSKLAAENTSEKYVADLAARELAVEQREAEVNSNVVIAEQGNAFTRWVRPVWAAPFVIYTWKIVVWDIVLGLGTTDPLPVMMANLMGTIAIAYYGGRSAEKVTAILANVFKKK